MCCLFTNFGADRNKVWHICAFWELVFKFWIHGTRQNGNQEVCTFVGYLSEGEKDTAVYRVWTGKRMTTSGDVTLFGMPAAHVRRKQNMTSEEQRPAQPQQSTKQNSSQRSRNLPN
jgi:hypothetical protein